MKPPPLLYYPDYHPDPGWLRAVLLFNEEVKRIVPDDVEINDPPALKELVEDLGGLTQVSPSRSQITPDALTLGWLEQALSLVGEQERSKVRNGKREFTIEISKSTGDFSFSGQTFISDRKLSDQVRAVLEKNKLIDHAAHQIASKLGAVNERTIVPNDASKIILSLVADRIARELGLTAITDQPLSYAMTALNGLDVPVKPVSGASEGMLAEAFCKFLVPKDIGSLPYSEYKILRQRSVELREVFAKYVQACHNTCELYRIESEATLQQRVINCAKEVEEEFQKFITGSDKIFRLCRDWWPLVIGGMLTLAKDIISPGMGLALSVSGQVIKFIEKGTSPSPDRVKRKLFQLAAGIGYDMSFMPHVENMLNAAQRTTR